MGKSSCSVEDDIDKIVDEALKHKNSRKSKDDDDSPVAR